MITEAYVESAAKELGFDLTGFAAAAPLHNEAEDLEEWLKQGFHGGMAYMERSREKRKDVRNILASARSVISLGMNYYTGEHREGNGAKVSRYAWGRDYHNVIWEKLDAFEKQMKQADDSFEAVSYVDTGPVMDKAWAVRAGLGWLGKHTNVINPKAGSWFFIASIITNYEFEPSPRVADHCGSCRACLDACPTGALIDEYKIDARKCISYLTIENKNEIPEAFAGKFDGWIFGCDICQDVCPWNGKFSSPATLQEFYPWDGNEELAPEEMLEMSNSQFKRRFFESPISRPRLKGMKRNALFILKDKEARQNES